MLSRGVASLSVALVFVACASGSGGATGGGGTPRRNTNLISAQEIAGASGGTAYELVQQLRPSWLVTRGGNMPIAYLDGVRYGAVEDLRTVGVDRIREVRFLDSREATTRFGTGHTGGAIEVLTRR